MIALLLLLLLLLPTTVHAHAASSSYLTLTRSSEGFAGYWDIALYDLDLLLDLDADGSGTLERDEVERAKGTIRHHALGKLTLRSGGADCLLERGASELSLLEHSDGPYARLGLRVRCPHSGPTELTYALLFDRDAQHRVLVHHGAETTVLSASERHMTLASAKARFGPLLRAGAEHILRGLDHLLFLCALLMPIWLSPAGRLGMSELGARLAAVAKLVTAFTLAHSLTLLLATIDVAAMAPSVIEPAIAGSVALSALWNLLPRVRPHGPSIAFALGLLHGFGFSSALRDLGLSGSPLLRALLAFNLGIELAQLAVVVALLPLLWLAARSRSASLGILRGGSLALLVTALFWLGERIELLSP